jgi:glycosyltransferase involved in cell wall biosynthesis
VLAEAMACGTPVLGYNDAAIPEVVAGGEVGRLFDRLEPRAIADALLPMLSKPPSVQTVAACRARAEQFSTDRCTERYLELYAELGVRSSVSADRG